MTLKPVPTPGRSKETRVQLHVPKEETFPVPLKYFDVTGSIYTDLDAMQEKRVDDHWNVDSNRSLSDSWKGFTKFTPLKEKPPKGYTGCPHNVVVSRPTLDQPSDRIFPVGLNGFLLCRLTGRELPKHIDVSCSTSLPLCPCGGIWKPMTCVKIVAVFLTFCDMFIFWHRSRG